MDIATLLTAKQCFPSFAGSSKKRVLQNIAHAIAEQTPNSQADELFRAFLEREQLGSTGVGEGVAIPHCRMANIKDPIVCVFTLESAIDFDSLDGQNVDLLTALVVPADGADEHVKLLGILAGKLSQATYRNELRKCRTAEQLHSAAVS